jgi:hypothetical protein
LALLGVGPALAVACAGDAEADSGVTADAQTEDSSLITWLDAGYDGPEADADGLVTPCGGEIQSGCVWTVPLGPDGKPADLAKVSARLRDATGHETPLLRVSGASACAGNALAWYVEMPDGAGPAQLFACPETCDLITATGQDVLLLPGCIDPQP